MFFLCGMVEILLLILNIVIIIIEPMCIGKNNISEYAGAWNISIFGFVAAQFFARHHNWIIIW